MGQNIFQSDANKIPKSDAQIVRVSMTEADIGGRKDGMPSMEKASKLAIKHVPSMGS